MKSMSLTDYRGLRGVVRWVLPAIRDRWPPQDHRDPIRRSWTQAPFRFIGSKYGECRWCGTEAVSDKGRKLAWHNSPNGGCFRYFAAVRCMGPVTAGKYPKPLYPVTSCAECGESPGKELDHQVALGVALKDGPRAYVRALLPTNLRWLCHDCHVRKTAEDRRMMTWRRSQVRML